jgi:hypothetical protein
MSYLRGPLTREQIERLRTEAPAGDAAAPAPEPAPAHAPDETSVPPAVADGVPVLHVDPAAPWAAQVGAAPGGTRLRPALALRLALRYDDAKLGLDHAEEWEALVPLDGAAAVDPAAAVQVDFDDRDFRADAPTGARYVLPAAPVGEAAFFRRAADAVERSLVASRTTTVLRNRELKLASRPGETREAFAARCDEAAQERADEETARIRDRLEGRRERLERALAEARRREAEAAADAEASRRGDLLAGAGAVLGALLGGRSRTRGIDALGRAVGGSRGVARAEARARAQREKALDAAGDLEELEREVAEEVAEIAARWDAAAAEVEEVSVRLEAADVHVLRTALVWIPSA